MADRYSVVNLLCLPMGVLQGKDHKSWLRRSGIRYDKRVGSRSWSIWTGRFYFSPGCAAPSGTPDGRLLRLLHGLFSLYF